MEAFVAAATGLTGRFVVEALCEARINVTAHVRPDSPRLTKWAKHFSAVGARVDTTPWEADALQARFAEDSPDLAFALLGTTKKRIKNASDGDYMAVDYGMTAMLIDALEAGGRTRFVYLSSLGTKAGATSAYMKARWLAEEHLRQSGLPHLIARPSFILGERDEPRTFEALGSGLLDTVLGTAGFFGAKTLARRYGSIQGRELGYALVRESLDWRSDSRIVHSDDLRSVPGAG